DLLERFAAVAGAPQPDVDDVDLVPVLRPGVDARVVPGALAEVAVLAGLGPGLAAVVGAEHAAVLGLDDGPDPLRIDRRDGHADDADRALRQRLVAGDLGPGVAAVGALPQPRPRATALQAVGRALHPPGGGVEHARVVRVHREVDGADLVVDEEDLF